MKTLRNLLLGIGLSIALAGCTTALGNNSISPLNSSTDSSSSTPNSPSSSSASSSSTLTERLSADITYEVEGTGGIGYLDMLYGATDEYGNGGLNHYMGGDSPISDIINIPTGSVAMLEGSGWFYSLGTLILRIKDDGKKVVEKEVIIGTDSISSPMTPTKYYKIDYFIPITN